MILAALLAVSLQVESASGELPAMGTRIPRGELLLAESGCTDCHAIPEFLRERLEPRIAPPLSGLGTRATADWLGSFLATGDGHGPAPDLTSSLSAPEREALLQFLRHDVRQGVAESSHTAARLESGRRIFHTIGCVACHEPYEEAWERDLPYWFDTEESDEAAADPEPTPERHVAVGTFAPESVPLDDLDQRHTVESLTAYLLDPVSLDPDGRMPDFDLDPSEARDLSVYLLRNQALRGARTFSGQPGLAFERYDDVSGSVLPEFESLEPAESGVVPDLRELPPHPEDHFALQFTGVIKIPSSGEWTFELTSDDGSRLEIDGKCVVDNDGLHGPTAATGRVNLDAGTHSIRIQFWEEGGGEVLELLWEGPGVAKGPPPAAAFEHAAMVYRGSDPTPVQPDLHARGEQVYRQLACGACHGDEGGPGSDLLDLPADRVGCLAEDPGPGLPRYALSTADRDAIIEVLSRTAELAEPLSSRECIQRSLARSRCYACHRRDDLGGPHPERAEHFRPSGDFDLGEEGRIPPHLTGVGSKLFQESLRSVLLEGERVRPYVATRMPRFGASRVEKLPELFHEVDGTLDWQAPASTPELRSAGRQLVGTKDGLGCIQCHRFMEVPSLGIQAVDLMHVKDRIQPGWFAQLLLDPQAVQLNSRMPSFWEDGQSPVSLLDRDPGRQAGAILAYLDQGTSAPLPPGLATPDRAYELETDGGTRTVSVFMEGLSPRTQLVGSPEGVHLAFDMQHSRLARLWNGRFFNAKGTWEGRAGVLEMPPTGEFVELPAGAPIAVLDDLESPWPEEDPERLGQVYDRNARPAFRYRIGPVVVTESTRPSPDSSGLLRRLEMRAEEPIADLFIRIHDDHQRAGFSVRVVPSEGNGGAALPVLERTVDGRTEQLVAPVWRSAAGQSAASLELEYTW